MEKAYQNKWNKKEERVGAGGRRGQVTPKLKMGGSGRKGRKGIKSIRCTYGLTQGKQWRCRIDGIGE